MAAIHWDRHLVELIRRTATDLPSDVEAALKRAWRREVRGGQGAWALQSILDGVPTAPKETGVLWITMPATTAAMAGNPSPASNGTHTAAGVPKPAEPSMNDPKSHAMMIT